MRGDGDLDRGGRVIVQGVLVDIHALAETPSEWLLAPRVGQIYRWLTAERLQLTGIHELLVGRGCQVSYQSLRRFVQKRNWRRRSSITVRMEDTLSGEVAEMDFGRLGLIYDPTQATAEPCGPADRGAVLFAALLRMQGLSII